MNLLSCIEDFADEVGSGTIEIYNEASAQFELAIYLRQRCTGEYKIQLERNTKYFDLGRGLRKSEMDVVVFTPDKREAHCIELKYPTQGQYPEQMFSACKDIEFLEQLTGSGFADSYLVFFADDHNFYRGRTGGIYGLFRAKMPIAGTIPKPTGGKRNLVCLQGTYHAEWRSLGGDMRYFIVVVKP